MLAETPITSSSWGGARSEATQCRPQDPCHDVRASLRRRILFRCILRLMSRHGSQGLRDGALLLLRPGMTKLGGFGQSPPGTDRSGTRAALAGEAGHFQIVYGRRRLRNRRKNSSLPALIELVLARPVVSAGLIAAELKISQRAALGLVAELAIREVTGRGRYRRGELCDENRKPPSAVMDCHRDHSDEHAAGTRVAGWMKAAGNRPNTRDELLSKRRKKLAF
ncbi:MAG: hypothetical protein EOQ86_31170 [Mesorhizobium sp.]|nr:MAG: hypothetical protein EOQ85_32630 [Mesorhizobium sp.]RWH76056.1 MAG: hypothetical protein EOQ86_31170 [Mesorhizobium sp.]RWH83435.1 MAG: hypothetical protein EOQ87_32970 [Mesorhizobium sp.]RWH91337.1 MAG: hypothetical protein EOQ88_32490 [Mesorhizobium sp.]RWI04749.1 MAG: hypothetical protein EOQ89_09260 [Mesorhizobium sp.]